MKWGEVYALVATVCGWRWAEIDELTLSALQELLDYWSRHPPAHLVLASAFGVRPAARRATSGFAELAALAPKGTLRVGGG